MAVAYTELSSLDAFTYGDDLRKLYAEFSGALCRITNQQFHDCLENENSIIIAAKIGGIPGRLIGVASLHIIHGMRKTIGNVHDVVVLEEFQGQGIGKILMGNIIQFAREAGVQELHLTSHPKRISANILYQSLGFDKRETNVYCLTLQN